ncbi:MAG: mannosyltransferase [Actinoplanes sp.]|nr:mannosyltransferase [Actinoplanes sp.]
MAAAVSCLTGLGHQPLSWDEAVTLSAARHTPGRLLALLTHTDAPLGFYYALMHGWVRLGDAAGITATVAWLRLPSAVAAIAAVALTAVLAADWYGPRAGLVAGALLAVHPLLVFYAHDARPYALATFLVVALTWLFVRIRRHPTTTGLGAYAVLATVTIYTHLFSSLVLIVHFLVVAVRGPRRVAWSVVAAAVAVAAVPLVLISSRETGEIGWIPPASAASIASVLGKLGGGVAMALALGVVATGAATQRITRRSAFLLAWALVPPLLLVLADLVTPVLVARYALVAVPGLAVAVAAAGIRVRNRIVVGGTILALVAGLATSVVQQSRPYKYEDFRGAAELIDDTFRPGDAVLYLPASTRVGFTAYPPAEPGETPVADIALRGDGAPVRASNIAGVEVSPAAIASRLRSHANVYLVGNPYAGITGPGAGPGDQAKIDALRRGYTEVWSRAFGVVTVTLFSRRITPAP